MNGTEEIKTLQCVVEALTPLDSAARLRVVEYVCNMLDINPPFSEEVGQGKKGQSETEAKRQNPTKPKAAQEYLRAYSYKIMTRRIAVMAVYLEREKGLKRFDLRDISESFRDAKEAKIPAYSQYARAIVMGFLAKEGDQLYATSKAEKLVDEYGSNSSMGLDEETP